MVYFSCYLKALYLHACMLVCMATPVWASHMTHVPGCMQGARHRRTLARLWRVKVNVKKLMQKLRKVHMCVFLVKVMKTITLYVIDNSKDEDDADDDIARLVRCSFVDDDDDFYQTVAMQRSAVVIIYRLSSVCRLFVCL